MLIGCIGDDFTGSGDLANTLAKEGLRTVLYSGVPDRSAADDVQAGVVALKSRSCPVADAIAQSLHALHWLRDQGCTQFFFKYCSTFDSTPDGNIGPVIDALADALNARKVIVCPAFPGTGRSVYQGHLFVGDHLLNESGMERHPITPMTDPDIRRWLAQQTKSNVGHVPATTVFQGAAAIRAALDNEDSADKHLIVVDAIRDADLRDIGQAAHDLPLITGGSGIALGLPANFGASAGPVPWRAQTGKGVVLSGSCSNTTRAQIAHHASAHPVRNIAAAEVITGTLSAQTIVDWLLATDGLPLAYTSADPDIVTDIQAEYGAERASEAVEAFFADVAQLAVAGGATRVITAGGETSGAVVKGLGITSLEIGPEIDPGVPALRVSDTLCVALKSGNFGAVGFFEKADRMMRGAA